MNQFELFVASSERARSDAWRYLRHLGELDCRIEEGMYRLKEIAQQLERDVPLSGSEGLQHATDDRRQSKKRRQSPASMTSQGPGPADNDQSRSSSAVLMESSRADLFAEYQACSRRVRRYAFERVKVAEELVKCGEEMANCLERRMAPFRRNLANSTEASPDDA
ncbi:hypothetical protein TRVL_03346 [Trypanosoma vivax]|nr:hypothetical protein TRVL_03346 [Trypanosoma vivax]